MTKLFSHILWYFTTGSLILQQPSCLPGFPIIFNLNIIGDVMWPHFLLSSSYSVTVFILTIFFNQSETPPSKCPTEAVTPTMDTILSDVIMTYCLLSPISRHYVWSKRQRDKIDILHSKGISSLCSVVSIYIYCIVKCQKLLRTPSINLQNVMLAWQMF